MEVVSRATLAIALHLSDWDREQGDALGRPTFMETVISRVGAGVVEMSGGDACVAPAWDSIHNLLCFRSSLIGLLRI